MTDFLSSEPFIVVKSEVYFQWLSFRLQALKEVQLSMAKHGPSNFGLSTCIVMHLIRHIVHSPTSDKPYLTEALRELRFEEVMHHFGMFFLHDLNTDLWCLEQIDEVDSELCRRYFAKTKSNGKALNRFEAKAPQSPNTEATPDYPCGETPDYHTWQQTLLNSKTPSTLIKPWTMEDGFQDSVEPMAINLFIAFTTDLIHAITLDYIKGGYPEDLQSLEEAMAMWTVETLDAFLHYPEFVASNWGLEGTVMGPKDKDPQHVDLFFPQSSQGLKDSGWDAALRWGYLKTFFAVKRTSPEDDFIELRRDLRRILTRLQCLPVASTSKAGSKGTIWMEGKKGFQIWVNPHYYRLKRLAVKKGGTTRLRKKKGLKSLAEQAKDFSTRRGERPGTAKVRAIVDVSDGDDARSVDDKLGD